MNPQLFREVVLFSGAAIIYFLVPGLIVLRTWRTAPDGPVRWIYAGATGLCINALIYQFASLLNIPMRRSTWVVLGAMYLVLFVVQTVLLKDLLLARQRCTARWWVPHLVAFIAIFAFHWSNVAGFPVLPGVDSYEHAVIGSLIVEQEGIPDSYAPYAPLASFSYHYGSHANTALLSLITGLPLHRASVFFAVLLVAMAAMAVASLAWRVIASQRAALAAGVIAGLASVFPAWYLNWGRIPQLAGVVLVTLIVERLLFQRTHLKPQWGLSLLVAGLFLIHYRMVIVLAYAIAGLGLVDLLLRGFRIAKKNMIRVAKLVALGMLVVVPWLIRIYQGFQFDRASTTVTASITPPRYYFSFERVNYLGDLPLFWIVFAVSALGLVFTLLRSREAGLILVAWCAMTLVFSNPYVVPLPVSGLVDFVTVLSVSFIPGAVFASQLATLRFRLPFRQARAGIPDERQAFVVYVVALAVVALAAMWQKDQLSQERYVYVKREDIHAFDWIRSNIPADSVMLSPLTVSLIDLVEPVDAGGWISYFTRRDQMAPLLIYRAEEWSISDYEARLKELVALQGRLHSVATIKELAARGVTHLYFGRRTYDKLDFSRLDASLLTDMVYSRNGVRVYELKN